MLHGQLGAACKPPFRREPAEVRLIGGPEEMLAGYPHEFSGPFHVLRWDVPSERLVAMTEVVPGVGDDLSLTPGVSVKPGQSRFVPTGNIVPRSIAAITVGFGGQEAARGRAICRVVTDRAELQRTIAIENGKGVCTLGEDLEFFLARKLVSITIETEPASLGAPAITLERRLPPLKLRSAPDEAALTAAEAPMFVFENLWPGNGIRLEFLVQAGWHKHRFHYMVPHSDLTPSGDGSRSYVPSAKHVTPGTPYFSAATWTSTVEGLLEAFGERFGVDRVKVTWSVSSVDPLSGGATAVGNGGWFELRR
jgi:hypothetical protein